MRFPRLSVQEWVEFLVDSGSDRTILHPELNFAARIPYHRLHSANRGIATGIGGARRYYSEPGTLVFEDDQYNFLQCRLDIFVPEAGESASLDEVPSVLGRDFLNLCDVRLNQSSGVVALDPLNINGGFILAP